MGKIFEALEKADKKNVVSSLINQNKAAEKRSVKTIKQNVVQLLNSKREDASNKLDRTLVAYHDPRSGEAELFKMLRTQILFPSKGEPPRTILITSALPGDGKSFVSANLAISIAQGVEEHVMLIDGDIRRPTLHERFGIGRVKGLSEYLAGGEQVSDVLVKTLVEKLTLLPAGEPPAKPTELMASKKMKALVEEVRSRYEDRYVLIDSPPPSIAAETQIMSQYVDGIILVVRAGKTPRANIEETIEYLSKEKLIGVVFNQADQSQNKHYDYYKLKHKIKSPLKGLTE
jgi:exopolysaccharide/PEP-CTERM locus tyrosine autokinase